MSRRRRVLFLVAGLFALALVAVGGPSAYSWIASRGRDMTVADAPARDVAVIFGAAVYPDGTPSPFTAARLDVGVQLFKTGRAKVLVVSGDNSAGHNRETSSMRRYLEAHGVPAGKIVEDIAGEDTYDTCIRLRDVFGVRTALLVTQSYHVPRAVATCRALGVDAVGVGDSSVSDQDFWRVGVTREFPANVKMVIDLVSRRPPVLVEPPSSAVAEALAA
jgi:vancomycin permeability regulator SanA